MPRAAKKQNRPTKKRVPKIDPKAERQAMLDQIARLSSENARLSERINVLNAENTRLRTVAEFAKDRRVRQAIARGDVTTES